MRNQLKYQMPHSYHKSDSVNPSRTEISREPITALIPVKDELHNIEEVIASVSFADEVLIVDSFSTDGTYEKALDLADKVLRRKFDTYSRQKNWAIEQASHEWILLIDADERITPELKSEILETLKDPGKDDDTVAYWIGRQNHFMGKRVNYSGWQNDKVIRLFRKSKCKYEDLSVHEKIKADGFVGKLNQKLYHNTYSGIDEYISKINHYASLQAIDYDKKTGKLTGYHFVIKPIWRFFKHYIIQGGFRDGFVGLTICYIQAYTVFMRYAKVWLLRRNID